MLTRRKLNLAGFLACVGLTAYALYAQYGLGLTPCPLCIFQRIGVIALGLVFMLAALHNPLRWGRYVYAAAVFASAAAGAGVAARHVWLQSLPPDKVPACGADLGYLMDTVPFAEVLRLVLTGSGECANIDWSFLGLSMPAWVLVAFVILGLAGSAGNAVKPGGRSWTQQRLGNGAVD